MPGPGPLLCPKEKLVYELNAMSQGYRNFTMTKKDDGVLLALKIPWQEAMEQVLAKMLKARCSCHDSSSEAASSSERYPTLDDLTDHLQHFFPSRQ
jgi:hypothetical protein